MKLEKVATDKLFKELLRRAPCPSCECTECLACKWIAFAPGDGGLRNDWSKGGKITSETTIGDILGRKA